MIIVRLGLPPVVRSEFWELPFPEQMAVIAHEAGHKYYGHLWARLFGMFRDDYRAMIHRQEFEADAFARRMGYGPQLAAFLKRDTKPACFSHPSTRDRVASLVR